MPITYPENRDTLRISQSSPLQVQDLRCGEIFEARMFDYSDRGIYFESDGIFQKGTRIYINLQNTRSYRLSGVLKYYNGEVRWRKDLKNSIFNYGYGIQFISNLRKHPRKPIFQNVQFGSPKGRHKGCTKNISASGIFIATTEELQVGQLLELNLPLKNGKTADIKGQIMWLNEEGFGLKFRKVK